MAPKTSQTPRKTARNRPKRRKTTKDTNRTNPRRTAEWDWVPRPTPHTLQKESRAKTQRRKVRRMRETPMAKHMYFFVPASWREFLPCGAFAEKRLRRKTPCQNTQKPYSCSRPTCILLASCHGPAFNNNRFNRTKMRETWRRKKFVPVKPFPFFHYALCTIHFSFDSYLERTDVTPLMRYNSSGNTASHLAALAKPGVRRYGFSPDGRRLAAGGGQLRRHDRGVDATTIEEKPCSPLGRQSARFALHLWL